MINNNFPIRIEAACMDNQAIEQKNYAKSTLKKRGTFLLAIYGFNLILSAIPSVLSDANGVLDILTQISVILFLFFFARAGFALAITIILITQTKDYNGGYIEVYTDRIVIKQKAPYINSKKWETCEIWFEDLIDMWNSTDKTHKEIYNNNLQYDRTEYVNKISFKFKTTGKSRADMAIKSKGNIFFLHFGGYNKEEILDLGRTIYSQALYYNKDLKYEEEPIIYKRIIRSIRRFHII